MSLQAAYDYIKENIDKDFNKDIAGNISYDCESEIEEMKQEILEEGENVPVVLYYEEFNGAYVFNDWDVVYLGMDYLDQSYIKMTLKDALNILMLQNSTSDDTYLARLLS